MKRLGLIFVLLCIPALLHAQATTSYRLDLYNQGAPNPFTTATLPAAAFVCNQARATGTNTVNPTRIVFNDPADATKDCIYQDPGTGPLFGLPFGNQAYEGTLVAINVAGPSPLSARSAPFTRPGTVGVAPTGLRVIQ